MAYVYRSVIEISDFEDARVTADRNLRAMHAKIPFVYAAPVAAADAYRNNPVSGLL